MSDPSALGTAGPIAEASPGLVAGPADAPDRPRSLASDAWHDLRRRPLFLISVALIAFLLLLAAFPQLFTSADPTAGDLARSRQAPSAQAWFGYDLLGRDVFARTIYGTRVSIIVGMLATTLTVLIGGSFGLLAGFYGGWIDGAGLARDRRLLRPSVRARRDRDPLDVPRDGRRRRRRDHRARGAHDGRALVAGDDADHAVGRDRRPRPGLRPRRPGARRQSDTR